MLRGTTLIPFGKKEGSVFPTRATLWGRCNGRLPVIGYSASGGLTGEARERVRAYRLPAHTTAGFLLRGSKASATVALLLSFAASGCQEGANSWLLAPDSYVLHLVELRGLEPLTSTLPVSRSPN
jgi:hypothetical protein